MRSRGIRRSVAHATSAGAGTAKRDRTSVPGADFGGRCAPGPGDTLPDALAAREAT
jgi:hypothetical protein